VLEVLLGVIQKAPRQLKVWFLDPRSLARGLQVLARGLPVLLGVIQKAPRQLKV